MVNNYLFADIPEEEREALHMWESSCQAEVLTDVPERVRSVFQRLRRESRRGMRLELTFVEGSHIYAENGHAVISLCYNEISGPLPLSSDRITGLVSHRMKNSIVLCGHDPFEKRDAFPGYFTHVHADAIGAYRLLNK